MFQIVAFLLVFHLLRWSDGRLYGEGRRGAVAPGAASYCFHAGAAVPDPSSSSLHLGFATEGASGLGVRADFSFLHHFPEGGTLMSPVFTHDSRLLGAFSHVTSNQAGTRKGRMWQY